MLSGIFFPFFFPQKLELVREGEGKREVEGEGEVVLLLSHVLLKQ